MAEIVLGVTGGIAAYKAVDVLRLLQRSGHSVRVVMTRSAERFVGAATFAALSGHPVGRSMFPPDDEPGYDHLDLARSADLLLIAPASANTLAKMAAGQADGLLGAIDSKLLAGDGLVTFGSIRLQHTDQIVFFRISNICSRPILGNGRYRDCDENNKPG